MIKLLHNHLTVFDFSYLVVLNLVLRQSKIMQYMSSQYAKRGFLVVVFTLFLIFSLVTLAYAATTIGTNFSTTGTMTVTPGSDSATSVRFQNAAGTNIFIVNSTAQWVGVGGAPQTKFEVQGTASASYLLTGNTLQVGGFSSAAYSRFGTNTATAGDISTTNDLLISGNLEVDLKSYFDAPGEFQGTASASYFLTGNTIQVGDFASVAYNRFGTSTTGHSNYITTSNDILVSGDVEVRGSVSFGGVASVSGVFILADGQVRPGRGGDGTTAFRFQNAAGSTSVLTIDTTNTRVGIGKTPSTTFDVSGTASVSSNFEAGGYASASTGFFTTNVVVGNRVASSSSTYVAEFGNNKTGTASFYFGGGDAATLGTCFQLKSTTGAWIYMRFNQGSTTPTLSTIRCH